VLPSSIGRKKKWLFFLDWFRSNKNEKNAKECLINERKVKRDVESNHFFESEEEVSMELK